MRHTSLGEMGGAPSSADESSTSARSRAVRDSATHADAASSFRGSGSALA